MNVILLAMALLACIWCVILLWNKIKIVEKNLLYEQKNRYALEMDFYAFQIYLGYKFEKLYPETRFFTRLSKKEQNKLIKDFTIVIYDKINKEKST